MVPIVVAEYDPRWPGRFRDEAARLADALGDRAVAIEHIGSTSVPGLAAKPVIDVLVGVRSLEEDGPLSVEAITGLGYEYVAAMEELMPYRRYFRRSEEGRRSHQIHLVERSHPFFVEHVAFRDFLRSAPEAAARYGELKKRLAAAHADDAEAYMDGKASLIAELRDEALAWAQRLLDLTVRWSASDER